MSGGLFSGVEINEALLFAPRPSADAGRASVHALLPAIRAVYQRRIRPPLITPLCVGDKRHFSRSTLGMDALRQADIMGAVAADWTGACDCGGILGYTACRTRPRQAVWLCGTNRARSRADLLLPANGGSAGIPADAGVCGYSAAPDYLLSARPVVTPSAPYGYR